MAKIFDTFMLRDELDMMHVRLEELGGAADFHVVTEAPVTHRGDPKPLYYRENAARFAPWAGKILHVVADLPDSPDPWVREHAQRDAAMAVLGELAADDDVVLIADIDEFPPRGFDFGSVAPAVSFRQRLAMYAVDWEHPEPHVCSVAARWGVLKGGSLAAARDARHAYPVADGGWHLTWLGGPEAQRAKLGVHCHLEMTPEMAARVSSGACYRDGVFHGDGSPMIPRDVGEAWPRMIRERRCPESWFRPRD